jgi:hypothetical protein
VLVSVDEPASSPDLDSRHLAHPRDERIERAEIPPKHLTQLTLSIMRPWAIRADPP